MQVQTIDPESTRRMLLRSCSAKPAQVLRGLLPETVAMWLHGETHEYRAMDRLWLCLMEYMALRGDAKAASELERLA